MSLSTYRSDADPVVHARAVGAGSVIGIGLAATVGLLWTAFAFSTHDAWAYQHLAWWLGGTLIGASLIAGLATGALSSARGAVAGAFNGATTAGVMVVAAGGLALLALAVNGNLDQSLLVHGHHVTVEFLRPYVAFWAAAGTMVGGLAAGVGGGLLPRRSATHPIVELATVPSITVASLNGSIPATVQTNGSVPAGAQTAA